MVNTKIPLPFTQIRPFTVFIKLLILYLLNNATISTTTVSNKPPSSLYVLYLNIFTKLNTKITTNTNLNQI